MLFSLHCVVVLLLFVLPLVRHDNNNTINNRDTITGNNIIINITTTIINT